MLNTNFVRVLTVLVVLGLLITPGQAVTIDTVPVGNLANTANLDGFGAVDYAYNIGKYEVTAGQYTEFLNAVAIVDTYDLFNTSMMSEYGCKIERSGSPGSYAYSVADGWANRPVNYVSWGDAARFANWLHNGQPTGAQDLTTTEDGAYYLNGARTTNDQLTIGRESDWKWAIPTEDEWYKAAYHKNDGETDNYFEYPTGNDTVPSNDLIDPDPGNNATYYDNGSTIDGLFNYCTEVGEHENSESPYGTFDQGGNVWEWNEAIISESDLSVRNVRGGSFANIGDSMSSSARAFPYYPTAGYHSVGFRVVSVPEPASVTLLICGLLASLMWWKRRK